MQTKRDQEHPERQRLSNDDTDEDFLCSMYFGIHLIVYEVSCKTASNTGPDEVYRSNSSERYGMATKWLVTISAGN